MKTIVRFLSLLSLSLAVTVGAPARAAADAGDFVVVVYNSFANDDFVLLALRNIPGNSRYFIADSGYSTNAGTIVQEGNSPSTNRQIQFDVAAAGIPFGTFVRIEQSSGSSVLSDSSQGTLTMVDRFGGGSLTKLNLAANGDQLLVYQTAGGSPTGAVTMISGFNASIVSSPPELTITNGWQVGLLPRAGNSGATSESNLPAGLVAYDGTNASTATALGLASFTVSGGTNLDNYKYNGSCTAADKSAFLALINNPANWVAQNTTEYPINTFCPVVAAPEINVQGNGNSIPDGFAAPDAATHTLFGSTPVTGGTISRTFTIQNQGNANLTVSAGGITVSGTNSGDFSVSGISLPATIVGGGSTTFVVTFDPGASGERNATVNIANNDSSENPYNFDIRGNGYVQATPSGVAPTPTWSQTIQNAGAGATRAVGATSTGDIIAASRVGTGSGTNIQLHKYSGTTGTIIWTSPVLDNGTSDEVYDMVVDAATGDAYIVAKAAVAGNTNWFVRKVQSNGAFGWSHTFDGAGSGGDEPTEIAFASDGNIVAAGVAVGSGGNNFGRVVKLNASTGGVIWAYDNPTALSQYNGLATDAAGNICVAGSVLGANQNGLVTKLSGAGGVIWSIQFDGSAGLADNFVTVGLDSAGACVAGGTTRTSPSNNDGIVVKFASANGAEVWRNNIAGSVTGTDSMNHLVIDGSDAVYAAGAIRNLGAIDRHAFVRKINSAGAAQWTSTRIGSAPDANDRYQNVRVSGGAVYAAGNIDNATRDILASRFDAATGAETWSVTYNGAGNDADDVFSSDHLLALTAPDTIAIGGETILAGPSTAGVVLRYAPSGPEMDVTGNGVSVADGDALPTSADHTDFGTATTGGGSIVRTFTVINSGSANLNLTNTPRVVVAGANASEFLLTTSPASSVAPAGNTTFQITFAPTGLGTRSATLSIANDDANENPYDFSIQGSGACPTIILTNLPNGTVGTPYNATTSASGGSGSYTYSVGGGALPSGLSRAGGNVSGNPTAPGFFQIRATDNAAPGTCFGTSSTVYIASVMNPGDLVIREFRTRGPAGVQDEFVEIVNVTANPVYVAAADGTSGFALAAEKAGPSCTATTLGVIANGATIPAGGSFLFASSVGYSLSNYGGAGAAVSNAGFAPDVCDQSGLALFRSAIDLTPATRIDAAGFVGSASPFIEGAGIPVPASTGTSEVTYAREAPGGAVKDTGVNASDFYLGDTSAAAFGSVTARLAAPGPQNLASGGAAGLVFSLADPVKGPTVFPNRYRTTSTPTTGTYYFRWKVTNNSAAAITEMRIRLVDVTTLNSPGYSAGGAQADLRLVTSADVAINVPGPVTALGLTAEPPPTGLPLRGGYNASVKATLPGGVLAVGASVYVNVALEYAQAGSYRYFVVAEGK